MDFHMFVVIGFGGGRFTTNIALKRPFARVYSNVLLQIVCPMEILAANGAMEFLERFVFARVSQPIVFARKLTATMVARIRLDRTMRIHVGHIFSFADERFRAQRTFERLRRAIRMDPLVLLQIPFGGQRFVAYGAFVCGSRLLVLFHVHLQTRFDVFLFALRTLDRIVLEQMEAIRVRQPDVTHQAVFVHESLAAVRTAFRLDVVRFTMPGDFRLRMEHLAARANIIFGLRTHLQVMPVPVLNQIREALEALQAQATLERCVVAVDAHVLDQTLTQHKAFRAVHTLVLTNVQMPFQMDAKIDPALECSAAGKTLGRMRCHVSVECANAYELLFARFAHVIDAIVQNLEQRFVVAVGRFSCFGPKRCPIVA